MTDPVDALLRGAQVPNQPTPKGSSGVLVPEHIARAYEAEKSYQGMLAGGIAAEPELAQSPSRHKEFMEKLERLMTEYKVHQLNVFWKGPFMMGVASFKPGEGSNG